MGSNKLAFDQIVAGEGSFLFPGILGLEAIKRPAARIVCADGESLSVQAGSYLYSTPKDNEGPYTEVEVGFPSVNPPYTWAPYFEGNFPKPHGLLYRMISKLLSVIPGVSMPDPEEDDPTGSVYCYIPVTLVREFIEAHGGEVYTVTDLDALRRE